MVMGEFRAIGLVISSFLSCLALGQSAPAPVRTSSTEPIGGAVAEARAHAGQFGNPDSYLKPAVFDMWQDIFRGRPTLQTREVYYEAVATNVLVGRPCSRTTARSCSIDSDCPTEPPAETCIVNSRPNRPLYAVISIGVNDVQTGTVPLRTFMQNIKEFARLCESNGIIPIFLSPPPIVTPGGSPSAWGKDSKFDIAHQFREAQRIDFLGPLDPTGDKIVTLVGR